MSGGYWGLPPGTTGYSSFTPTAAAAATGYAAQAAAAYPTAMYGGSFVPAGTAGYGFATTAQVPGMQGMQSFATQQTQQTPQQAAVGGTMGTSAYTHTGSAGFGGSSTQSSTGSNAASNSYDAAVYAVATSYLNTKQPSTGTAGFNNSFGNANRGQSNFRSFPSGRGRGSFRGGRGGLGGRGGGNSQPAQVFFCDVCKISCAGAMTYKEHMEGQRHKKKAALGEKDNSQALPRSRYSYRCTVCDVLCSSADTYNAHIKGTKHVKTVKLLQQMGKPIPSEEPLVIAPGDGEGAADKPPAKAIKVGAAVKSAMRTSDNTKEAILLETDNVEPVGADYIECTGKTAQEKSLTFHCKLCDCNFNDVNAKDLHLKGRRHRLAYKKKVDPTLPVDVPRSQINRRQMERELRRERFELRQQHQHFGRRGGFMGGGGGPVFNPRRTEFLDDRHVMSCHEKIAPSEAEITAIQTLVSNSERALKQISDAWVHSARKSNPKVKAEAEEDEGIDDSERVLKGVMRVGRLAKSILLGGELDVELVILCGVKPTRTMVKNVHQMLPGEFKKIMESAEKPEVYEVVLTKDKESIEISSAANGKVTGKATLLFTSPLFSETEAGEDVEMSGEAKPPVSKPEAPEPKDMLNKAKCLQALSKLRHAKWFQARCVALDSYLIVLRVLRDVARRVPTWAPMDNLALELLVEKALISAGGPMSPCDALRRVFEVISMGLLYKGGSSLVDPCEKEMVDVLDHLTDTQREDLTCSAQHALRLISFGQLYKILEVERLKPQKFKFPNRKRLLDDGSNNDEDETGETAEKQVKTEVANTNVKKE